jgi:hypothetical protein
MKNSNNNTYVQHQKIGSKLSGLSGKLYYSAERKKNIHRARQEERRNGIGGSKIEDRASDFGSKGQTEDSSRYCIQTYSQRHKSIKRLFKIQEQVLNNDIHKTVRYCRRQQAFHAKEIVAYEGKKSGNIKGTFLCGSSHCPACFGRIAQEKRKDLKKVIEYSKEKKMRIAMMTLTFSHQYGNDLQKILESLSKAKTYLMRQRKFKKINVQWHISRLEFTYSKKNGFHPHYHIAMGINESIDEDEIKQEWIRVCEKFGLSCSHERGADFVIDEKFEGVEKYIMKEGKTDISFEVASDGVKNARNENVCLEYLMDVLAGYEKTDEFTEDEIKKILLAYYAGIKGKAIFSVSNSFKDLVERIQQKEEEQEEEQDDQALEPGAPCLRIGRWILHFLAMNNRLDYLYDFVGHNNLTKLYDDLIAIVPEQMIGGIVWINGSDDQEEIRRAA